MQDSGKAYELLRWVWKDAFIFVQSFDTEGWVLMQQIIKMQECPSPSRKKYKIYLKTKSEEELQH